MATQLSNKSMTSVRVKKFQPPLKKQTTPLGEKTVGWNTSVLVSSQPTPQVHTLLSFCEDESSLPVHVAAATKPLKGKENARKTKTYQYKYFNAHKQCAIVSKKITRTATSTRKEPSSVVQSVPLRQGTVYDYPLTPASTEASAYTKLQRSKEQVSIKIVD